MRIGDRNIFGLCRDGRLYFGYVQGEAFFEPEINISYGGPDGAGRFDIGRIVWTNDDQLIAFFQ